MKPQLFSLFYILLIIGCLSYEESFAINPAIPQIGNSDDIDNDEDGDNDGRVESGGKILGDETLCNPSSGSTIINTESPSGTFVELLQVRWEKRVSGGEWIVIPGANSLSFNPGTILVTTHFRRGCREFSHDPWEYSNTITKARVDGIDRVIINKTDVTCKDGFDGFARASVLGGTPGYTFEWSNGASGIEQSDLPSGEYYVIVTDSYGCSKSSNVIKIDQPANAVGLAKDNILEPTCPGDSTGLITIKGLHGTPPYTYTWSNGETGSTQINLPKGEYSVTIRDANGCTSQSETIILTEPDPFHLEATTKHVTCSGFSDAASTLSIEGGTAPYIYFWHDGVNEAFHDNLEAGNYNVFAVDANNCIHNETITIEQPDSLIANTHVVNNKLCKASANIVPDGGTAPYSYDWGDLEFDDPSHKNDLCPGIYSIRVKDNNGCLTTETFEVEADYKKEEIVISILVNPFNTNGNIEVALPYEYPANLTIYSPTGQIIEHINHINLDNQKHFEYTLEMDKYSDGMYLITVQAGDMRNTEKIIIRK